MKECRHLCFEKMTASFGIIIIGHELFLVWRLPWHIVPLCIFPNSCWGFVNEEQLEMGAYHYFLFSVFLFPKRCSHLIFLMHLSLSCFLRIKGRGTVQSTPPSCFFWTHSSLFFFFPNFPFVRVSTPALGSLTENISTCSEIDKSKNIKEIMEMPLNVEFDFSKFAKESWVKELYWIFLTLFYELVFLDISYGEAL